MTKHFEWPLHVREISIVHMFSLCEGLFLLTMDTSMYEAKISNATSEWACGKCTYVVDNELTN